MTSFALLCKMAVLMTGIAGMQAAGPPRDDIDSTCLLQLSVEDAPGNASSAAEASAGAKGVDEIAKEEMATMESIMGKELDIMGKALAVMGKSMGDVVEMKKMELGVVGREQGTKPAGPQEVEGPGPEDESPYPQVAPLTSGAQEKAQGATTNGTQVVENILEGRVLGHRDSSDPPWASSAVASLDLAATDTALYGFYGGFADGTYGYALPNYNGLNYVGAVVRFDLAGFATTAVLDLAATDPALGGFYGGFTDGTYGYCVPYSNRASTYSGKVARFDLAGFATTTALDLAATDPSLKGFIGGFTDGTYGYVLPYYNEAKYHGKVARFDLAGFATIASLDLAATDPALKGFMNGFTDGTYGYVIPYYSGAGWSGKVARFDLAGFATTTALDLQATDPALKSFHGGFTDGTYGYAIQSISGRVARFDLAGFATTASLDLEATDPALKGFRGGLTDGTYGYAIPFFPTPDFSGRVARFDLAGFATTAVLDLEATDPALKGFRGGFTDGTYGYVIPKFNGKVARFGVIKHVPLDTLGQNDQSSVVGDPHVVNVAHARFEIRAEGVHKLLQIPQLIQSNNKPDLRVDAKIQHLVSNDCSKSFMTSLSIFGRWTEDAFGLMRISQGSDMPNTTLLINTQSPEEFFKQFPVPGVKAGHASVTFKLRDVSFHLGKHFEGRYGKQQAYLNVRIAGLKKYSDIGGLLGYDDHTDAEKLAVNCTAAGPAAAHQSSFIGSERSAPITTDGGSRIEAE